MNYTELYDIKPDEIDFYGAIKRWKESGMEVNHLDNLDINEDNTVVLTFDDFLKYIN